MRTWLLIALIVLIGGVACVLAAEAPPRAPRTVPTVQSPLTEPPAVIAPQSQQPAAPTQVIVPAPQVTIEQPGMADKFQWLWMGIAALALLVWAVKIGLDRNPPTTVQVDPKALLADPEFKKALAVEVFHQRFSAREEAVVDPFERLIAAMEAQRALPRANEGRGNG